MDRNCFWIWQQKQKPRKYFSIALATRALITIFSHFGLLRSTLRSPRTYDIRPICKTITREKIIIPRSDWNGNREHVFFEIPTFRMYGILLCCRNWKTFRRHSYNAKTTQSVGGGGAPVSRSQLDLKELARTCVQHTCVYVRVFNSFII